MKIAVAHRLREKWAAAIIALMVVPVFVDTDRMAFAPLYLLTGPPAATSPQGLHLSFLLVVPLAALALRGRTRAPMVAISVLAGVSTFSALVGQFVYGFDVLRWVFYFQTVVPLCGFIVGATWRWDPLFVAKWTLRVMTTTLLVIIAYAVSQGWRFTNAADATDALHLTIPQYRNLFPMAVAIAVAFAVAYRNTELQPLARRQLVVALAWAPLMWSRTGLVMIFVAAGAAWLHSWTGGRNSRVVVGMVVALGAVVVGLAVFQTGTVGARLGNSEVAVEEYDERRADLALSAVGLIADSPIVGRMFEPEWTTFAGGQEVNFRRLYNPHNQILDYGLRGGAFAVVAFVLILVGGLWRARRLAHARSEIGRFGAAMSGVLLAGVLGCFSNLYFVQTHTGTLLWFLIGLLMALTRNPLLPSAQETDRRSTSTPPMA